MNKSEINRLLIVTGLSWAVLAFFFYVCTGFVGYPDELVTFTIILYGMSLALGVPTRSVILTTVLVVMVVYLVALAIGLHLPTEGAVWVIGLSFFVYLVRKRLKD